MILLLGATGYLGQAFSAELRNRGLAFTPLTRSAVDYTRFDVLFNYVRATKPSFLINAAGFTGSPDLDTCETLRAETVQANTLLPQTIARICYLTQTPWGHVSSGSIFSGARISQNGRERIEPDLNQPDVRRLFEQQPDFFHGFVETDEPNFSFRSPPCSFYCGTKALAEEALRWFGHAYLWRPRIVFDEFVHPRNFLSKIQSYPKVHDSLNSFTHRGDFARACLDLLERNAPFGIYNIVNPGALTGRQVVGAIDRVLRPGRRFEFWENDEEFHRHAVKAHRSSGILSASKLLAAGVKMRPASEALEDSLAKWSTTQPSREWLANARAS
jgi:UDP-glucose 4,6-dehydratase